MAKFFEKIEDIEIWQEGCRLAVDICRVTARKEFNKYPRLRNQMQGSAISIPSNVAEGYESQSFRGFIKFLYYSKRSAGELRTQVYIARKLELISKEEFTDFLKRTRRQSKKTASLIKRLKKSN